MHEALTNSSSPTKNFSTSNPDDLQTPISRKHRLNPTDSFGWAQANDSNTEYTVENWTIPNDSLPIHLTAARRNNSAGFQKIPYAPMPTRTDNSTPERTPAPGHRWRFNTNGQLVDSESPSWELADEIVRLKIGEATGDDDTVHGQLRTPAKSKLAAAAVTQLNEASPLETSSSTSVGSSPHASEHEIHISHSRGPSTDTTVSSSRESVGSPPNKAVVTKPPLKVNTGNDIKERPHSFSGGLSTADLRRLQQAGEVPDAVDRQQNRAQGLYRENMVANAEQLSYPSLLNIHRPQPQPHPQLYDYRNGTSQLNQAVDQDEIQMGYQQRHYNPAPPNLPLAGQGSTFLQGRPTDNNPLPGYRQPPRGYPQQNIVPNPSAMGYASHTSHLSLANTQQLYDMMLPGPHHDHPSVTRVQQQHSLFRPSHHHSASDPSANIRDAAALVLMNNGNMQPFAPGIFQPGMPPMPLYPNQYYGAEQYQPVDPAAMAARLQTQYQAQYPVLPPPVMPNSESVSSPTSTHGQGPSANNRKLGLYKTELCRSWEEKGSCRYATKCQFAHGEEELRKVTRHPKYKTEICRTFWVSGTCPYGKRCCFIHTELPTAGVTGPVTGGATTPGTESTTQQISDGRGRSLSTISDPNETNVSLLARISGKRTQESTASDGNSFQFTRPPTGSLRVDTSALDTSVKQNKSAYPSFTSNGILLPAPEQKSQKSPGPVTAGPDLGRHDNARREIVGYNRQRTHKANASSASSIREIDVEISPSPPIPSYGLSSGEGNSRPNGHVRAGSAGNWGSFSRQNLQSPYAAMSSAGEIIATSPWPSGERGVGLSRMHEKVWA